MSVYIYDEAIVERLRTLTGDSRIFISPPDNIFRTIGQVANDTVQLPLISLVRTGYSILDARPHMMKFEGTSAGFDEASERFQRVQMVPIRINYLMDVWTKNREENDNIVRELIFYYSTHPTHTIHVDYGVNFDHKFNVILNNDVEDNSDIVEHKNRGEYFRQTLSMYTDDAYLWKSSSRGPTRIDSIKYEFYGKKVFIEEGYLFDIQLQGGEDYVKDNKSV